jgi:hypothetical protein
VQAADAVPLGGGPLDEAGGALPVGLNELPEELPLDAVPAGEGPVDDPPWHSLAQVVF